MRSVLLVAVGGYGENYLKEMTLPETKAEIVGVCDVMPNLLERYPVLGEKNIPVYASVDAFYQEHQADLAIISAPIHCHTDMVLTCLANGSHVLCEKPLCVTREEADAIDEASKRAGRFVAIGYQMNYRRDYLALKEDILAGRFGAPKRMRVIHAMRRGTKYYGRNAWAGRIAVDGIPVMDSPFHNACAHHFQLMTFLLGKNLRTAAPLARVDAELYRANDKLENFDTAALRFWTEDGVPLCYYTTHALKTKTLGPDIVYEFEEATITLAPGDSSFRAICKDGQEIDYGRIDPGSRMQKMYDALHHLEVGGSPVCGFAAEYPRIDAGQMLLSHPIQPVDPANLFGFEEDGDAFICIHGIEDTFRACAQAYALPSELGITL